MKEERETILKKKLGCIGGGGGECKKLSADFNINLHSACMMQELDFSCSCVTACMFALVSVCTHVCVSVSPRSIFACANRCFASLPCSRGQAPPSFSRLPSPLFSPFTSICSSGEGGRGGMWVTPASRWRRGGIRSLTYWSPLQLELQGSSLPTISSKHVTRRKEMRRRES